MAALSQILACWDCEGSSPLLVWPSLNLSLEFIPLSFWYDAPLIYLLYSILKFFQVDITGIVRMTSCARYCKEGVGSRRPNWRWIMCFLELPKANTSCKAFVKHLSCSCGSSDDTKSSMTLTKHSTCTCARR